MNLPRGYTRLNEIYYFLIPVNIEAYKDARQEIGDLKNKYEQARMRFHKKKLDPSITLRRATELLDTSIADLDKIKELIPNFEEVKMQREKRQIMLPLVVGLGSFLLRNVLNLGRDSHRLDKLDDKLKLFSKTNLEFQDA